MTFTVTVQPAGRSFSVASDETVLSAAIVQGVGLPYGCKDGACSACKCRLLEGKVVHGEHQEKALSADEEAQGWILTCRAVPQTDCVIESRQVSAVGQFPVVKLPARVQSMERAAPDVIVLRLQLPASQPFQYHAGQYVDVLLKDGERRSYSMAAAPEVESGVMELHIRHMPGGRFTDHVFQVMKEKEILRLEGPFGSFYLREDSDAPIVLLASGTGFAPVKAMLEHLKASGSRRKVSLYWGCRRKSDLYRDAWVHEMAAQMPQLTYVPVLSEPAVDDAWIGRTGLVHEAVMADWPDLSGHQVYACGAPIMVESAQRDFAARCGLLPEAFFADAFTSAADKTSS